MSYYIYTFQCAKCGHVWQRKVSGSRVGFGNATNPCPECGCGNVRKLSEEKVES